MGGVSNMHAGYVCASWWGGVMQQYGELGMMSFLEEQRGWVWAAQSWKKLQRKMNSQVLRCFIEQKYLKGIGKIMLHCCDSHLFSTTNLHFIQYIYVYTQKTNPNKIQRCCSSTTWDKRQKKKTLTDISYSFPHSFKLHLCVMPLGLQIYWCQLSKNKVNMAPRKRPHATDKSQSNETCHNHKKKKKTKHLRH